MRPVYFPRIDGHMEWVGPDGDRSTPTPSTTPSTAPARASACAPRCRCRASGCRRCSTRPTQQLLAIRAVQPHAGGLVIAMDQRARPRHRRAAAPPPRGHRHPGAERRPHRLGPHRALRRGRSMPWIVAVRMVSEGVDIPRLRVGRVRHQHRHRAVLPPGRRPPGALDPGHAPPEGVLLHPRRPPPAHATPPRSPSSAATACAARTTTTTGSSADGGARRAARHRAAEEEQLSLFSVHLGRRPRRRRIEPEWVDRRRRRGRRRPDDDADDDDELTIDLAPPPRPGGGSAGAHPAPHPPRAQGPPAGRERRPGPRHRAGARGSPTPR